MQISENTYLGLLNEIAQLKDELANQTVAKFNFTELKPNTTYIVEFREDMDICTIGKFMNLIAEKTKEMHNKYIVSSPRIKFREEKLNNPLTNLLFCDIIVVSRTGGFVL